MKQQVSPISICLIVFLPSVLLTSTAMAQPAYMVADLELGSRPHFYGEFALPESLVVGSLAYFRFDDGVHGQELWRSDGTALGTYLLRDLCPGSCGSRDWASGLMAALGDELLFVANDGTHGLELWRTDGTALGTSLVLDIEPGYLSSTPFMLTSAPGLVYFIARTQGQKWALWRTDGTSLGTFKVSLDSRSESFLPAALFATPDFLYACGVTATSGSGLWRSDGTPSGTQFVAPVSCNQGTFGKAKRMAALPDGDLLFVGGDGVSDAELWRSDGTLAGTVPVADLWPSQQSTWPSGFARVGDEVVFATVSGLWRSDGTPAGTAPIALPDGAAPFGSNWAWEVVGERYFFAASDSAHGAEPWVLDGWSAERIVDLRPGPESSLWSSTPNSEVLFAAANGGLVFSADDGVSGLEFWKSDGSAAGTQRISDIAPGNQPFVIPSGWAYAPQPVLAERLLTIEFQASTGTRLWRLDASGTAMELVRALDAQGSAFLPSGRDRNSMIEPGFGRYCFSAVGENLYFELGADPFPLYNSPQRYDLWRSDGSASGTDPRLTGWAHTSAYVCETLNGRLLFPGGDSDARVLLAVDPLFGEEVIAPAAPESADSDDFLVSDGLAYFFLDTGLWRTAGTAATTTLVAEGVGSGSLRTDPWTGEVLSVSSNVWLTDPEVPSGAIQLTNFDSYGFTVLDAASLPGGIVFFGYDSPFGQELWFSDRTQGSGTLLADIRPGPASGISFPIFDLFAERLRRKFGAAGNYAVFAANNGLQGEELWITDGTALGTGLLRDIYPGEYPSTPRQFTRLGDRVVFSAEDEEHGLELWVTDGTYPGTTLLKDVAPGLASSVPDDLVVRDGVLYFSAWSPSYGREAWKSDGTAAGTVRISDVAPGPLSSSPQRFTRAGNRLYFSATDHIHGYELWAISDDGSVPLFLDGFEDETTDRWSETLP